jgi:hypothetical protein
MGGGISIDAAQRVLAPTAAKRAGANRRRVKKGSDDYLQQILERFDKSKTGTLLRPEVKELCMTIMSEITPLLGKRPVWADAQRFGAQRYGAKFAIHFRPLSVRATLPFL